MAYQPTTSYLTRDCRFILNGLVHANTLLGEEVFRIQDWRVIGEYIYDAEGGRHQAFYSPVRDTFVMGELIRPHERVQVEQSLKYSQAEAEDLWHKAGVTEVDQWKYGNEYGELTARFPGFRPTNQIAGPFPFEEAWSGYRKPPPRFARTPCIIRCSVICGTIT